MDCPKCGAKADSHASECPICFASFDEPSIGGTPSPGGLSSIHNMAIPKEEEYMPIVGIPGLDHASQTPQPQPSDYLRAPGQPAAPQPNYLTGNQPTAPPPNYLAGNEPAAPLPNYLTGTQSGPLTGAGGGEVRVSLTGEVVQSQGGAPGIPGLYPQQPQPGGYPPPAPGAHVAHVPGAPIPPRTAAPGRIPAPAPARPTGRATRAAPIRSARSEPKGGGGAIAVVIVVLVLLAGGGAGGWWFWQQKQRAPGIAMEKYLTAFKNKDWKTFYQGIDWPEQQKAMMTESLFEQQMSIVGNMVSLKDFKVGDVTNNGDTATVSVSQTVSLNGGLAALAGGSGEQTKSQQVPMKLVGGQWKVDGQAALSAMGGLAGGGMPKLGSGAGKAGGAGRRRR